MSPIHGQISSHEYLEVVDGRALPGFVSVEAVLDSFDEVFTQISTLWNLGYRRFKLINQGLCHTWRCPTPPREGEYVDVRFDDFSSGPFGEESPGKWVSIEKAITGCQRFVREFRYYRYGGVYGHTWLARGYRHLRKRRGNPISWYDSHAKLSDSRD